MPLMSKINVMLFESRTLLGQVGPVIAQTQWDDAKRAGCRSIPEGEPALLGHIIRWHGATEVMWIGT